MKIAVASEGKKEESLVCPYAGRAPFYLLFEDKKLVKALKNPFSVGGGGAGLGVVQMLNNENVDVIVSGKFGPNMVSAMEEKEMKSISVENKTVKAALEEIEE